MSFLKWKEVEDNFTLKRVNIRKKSNSYIKGYKPIYKSVDECGTPLTYFVKDKIMPFEFNTLKKAKRFAAKLK